MGKSFGVKSISIGFLLLLNFECPVRAVCVSLGLYFILPEVVLELRGIMIDDDVRDVGCILATKDTLSCNIRNIRLDVLLFSYNT
jgi:hypothetical protein